MNMREQALDRPAPTGSTGPKRRTGAAPDASSLLRGKRVGMIVFSSYPFDPRPRRAADALTKAGAIVEYICLADANLPRREVSNGIDVRRVAVTHRRGGKVDYILQYSAFILFCTAILAWRSVRRRYDLVYVHNMPDVLVVCALLPKLLGAKVVLDMHDPMPELMTTIFGFPEESFVVHLMKRLERWSFARAHLVVAVNRACKRLFSERSCPVEKLAVVMNTPDGDIFPFDAAHVPARTVRDPDRPFVIMYHGSLVERNGVHLAIRALDRVRRMIPTAELRIYGKKTEFLDQVMEEARGLGLGDAVRYLGPRRLEDLVNQIRGCDAGVIPNLRNAFTDINTPTRIFEYLALGKPVIAPSTPGVLDYFGPDSLLFFEAGNVEQLAEQMQFIALHPREAALIAERGQKIYQDHTWQREREHLLNVTGSLFQDTATQ